jgi:hypothetical protein
LAYLGLAIPLIQSKAWKGVLRNQSTKRCAVAFLMPTLTSSVATGYIDEEESAEMGEWDEFFLASAGAAGVLTGLVFVGVSINLEKIISTPRYGLTGRALEALVLLLAVLVMTSLLLVPGQGMVLAGVEVLAVGVADWTVIVAIQLLHLRSWQSLEPNLRGHLVVRVVLGQVATLPFVVAGVAVLGWGVGGLYWLVAGVVLSYLVAVADAWVLLVEIHR